MQSYNITNSYSVLLTTYCNEKVEFLKCAVDSLIVQTLKPSEIIIVVDGPVPKDQEEYLDLLGLDSLFNIIKLKQNVGRGKARNIGVSSCRFNYIAIMDSDDICHPDRFKKSLEIIESCGLDLVSSVHEEFDSDTGKVLGIKKCPEYHADIIKHLKFTCVISNPTIIFRKSFFDLVGGYPDYRIANEDYLLFLRLVKAGAKFYCFQEPLLKFRISKGILTRRRGFSLFSSDFEFRMQAAKEGHFSYFFAAYILIPYAIKRFSPLFIYKLINRIWRSI